MATPIEKGDALQNAVEAIERIILRTSPSLKEKTFVIESKKIISVDGVHHEIDIFVTIDPAPGYQSVSIFECKNWKNPVGKNEIVTFSEKIDVASATHGYFVAKQFTRDARAQAKKDKRMTLLLAKAQPLTGPPILEGFHMIAVEPTSLAPTFIKRGSTGKVSVPLDMSTARATINGQPTDLRTYLIKLADEITQRDTLSFRSERLLDGSYPQKMQSKIAFRPGEFFVNDDEIESVDLQGEYLVWVFHPPIVSHFDVENRGRAMTLAPIKLPFNSTCQITLAEGRVSNSKPL